MKARSRLTFNVSFEVEGGAANATKLSEYIRSALIEHLSDTIMDSSVRVQIQKRVVTFERSKP